MKHKILLLVLILLAPLSASAEIYADIDGISYGLFSANGHNYAWVYGATSSNVTTVTIPETVTYENATYNVELIRKEAFASYEKLKTVSIPRTMKEIENDAFNKCKALTAVHITDVAAWCKIKFENIHSNPLDYAQHLFLNGEEVTDLVIPEGVTSVGQYAFPLCNYITSVTIPSTLKTAGTQAFYFYYLTAVHITDLRAWCEIDFASLSSNPLTFAHHLYLNGEEVTEWEMPSDLTSVKFATFAGCTGLTSVTLKKGMYEIDGYAFSGCTGLTSVIIPSSVTAIKDYAFSGCTGLATVTLPYNLKNIYSFAFKDCNHLKDVYCYAENVPSISSNTFENSSVKSATLYVPEASISAYSAAAVWKEFKSVEALTDVPTTRIEINETNFPDANFRTWLLSQSYGADGVLAEAEIENITTLNVSNQGIKRLKGIEYFTSATIINCSQNEIQGADMDELIACLPVVSAGELRLMHYENEQNMMYEDQVADAKAKGWTARYCIRPDYWTWFDYPGIELPDNTPVVVTKEQVGYLGFWGWVWTQDYGKDYQLTEREISKITEIFVPNRYFADLNGIEYFTALTELTCNDNYISTIDLSKNTALKKLECYDNRINGDGAYTFVWNLPTVSEGTIKFNNGSSDENSMSPALVKVAKAKGWTLLYFDGELWEWKEYAGNELEPVVITDVTLVNPAEMAEPGKAVTSESGVTASLGTEDVVDAVEGSVTMTSSMTTNEVMTLLDNAVPDSPEFSEAFKGFYFKLVTGKGKVEFDIETLGNYSLGVMEGNTFVGLFTKATKGTVTVEYDVPEDTWFFAYPAIATPAGVRAYRAPTTSDEGALKVYSLKIVPEETPSAVKEVEANEKADANSATIYDLNGRRLTEKPKSGFYIQGGKVKM